MGIQDRIDKDESLKAHLGEMELRESYHLLEKVFGDLERMVLSELKLAETDRDLLYNQAYYRALDDIRNRLSKFRGKTAKREIIVGGN